MYVPGASGPGTITIGPRGVGFTERPETAPWYNQPTYSPPPTPPISPIVTGIEPAAYEAILYGKEKPLFVGGRGLMGGRPNEGIFWSGTQTDPRVSFIAYHAQAANPTGTRTITDARLRGKSVTYDGSGNLLDAELAGGKVTFRTGTRNQLPFQQSIDRYGAGAIAYRDGILSSWENIPVKPFGGIVPMPSIEISDSSFGDPDDGITRQDALEVILRYSRLDDSEFEVSVPGSDTCWIVGSKSTLLNFLQQLRGMFVHWNITSTDKLYITDPTSLEIDVDITRNNHLRDSMMFRKMEPLIIPRKKNYNYIDQDRDFEPNIVSAQEDPLPAPSTSSIEESTITLPIVTTAAQATADVHVSLFEELAAKSQMSAVLMPPLFAAAAGDSVRFADHDDINYIGRIMETQHDFDTYQVDIQTVEVLNCGAEVDDDCGVIPDGAIIHLNYKCPEFFIDDVEYAIGDIHGGSGSPDLDETVGATIDGDNGWYPTAINDLLDRWAGLATGAGFTVVVTFRGAAYDEFNPTKQIVTLESVYDSASNGGDAAQLYAFSDYEVRASTNPLGNQVASADYVPTERMRVAWSFLKGTPGKIAIALNGVFGDTGAGNIDMPTMEYLMIGHVYEDPPFSVGSIETITVYALQDDGDLAGLSELP